MTNVLLAQPASEWLDAPRVTREAFPAKFAGCDPRVPYALLEDAKLRAEAAYPLSARVVALWTPNSRTCEVHVEVWDAANRRARVISAEAIGHAEVRT